MPLSADDVRGAYRFILGREPESDDVVAYHQRNHASFEALRLDFLSSPEFRNKALPGRMVSLDAPPLAIETATDQATLRAIIAKVAGAWEGIGETAPHYSVYTCECYRPDQFAANDRAFFESGKGDLDLLLAVLRRIGRPAEGFNRCLEFGCGVGRVTAQLAATFSEVVALDISRPHLRLAQAHVARLGHTNVSFLQVTPENLHPGMGYDLWFSRVVLQHNPPPVTLAILDKMFAGLAPQGVALVHVPTYRNDYSFNVSNYLARKFLPGHMDMHATPQKPILELAWHHSCRLLDIREEQIPEWVTNVFVFQKS